jgi:hypothetical protein
LQYEAINGSTGKISFGGAGDAGGIDGDDAAAVANACYDALTAGGSIYIKKGTYVFTSSLDMDVGYAASVALILEAGAVIQYGGNSYPIRLLERRNSVYGPDAAIVLTADTALGGIYANFWYESQIIFGNIVGSNAVLVAGQNAIKIEGTANKPCYKNKVELMNAYNVDALCYVSGVAGTGLVAFNDFNIKGIGAHNYGLYLGVGSYECYVNVQADAGATAGAIALWCQGSRNFGFIQTEDDGYGIDFGAPNGTNNTFTLQENGTGSAVNNIGTTSLNYVFSIAEGYWYAGSAMRMPTLCEVVRLRTHSSLGFYLRNTAGSDILTVGETGDLTATGIIKASGGYRSSDNTAGQSATVTLAGLTSITFKNGLYVSST